MAQQTQQPPNGREPAEDWAGGNTDKLIPDASAPAEEEEMIAPDILEKIWEKRAKELAKVPPAAVSGQTKDLLLLRLKDEKYGIDVKYVREIFPLGQLTPVPRTPDFVIGIFSARGRILSIIDLRVFLGLSASYHPGKSNLDDQTKIVVVSNNSSGSSSSRKGTSEMEVGIFADDVLDMVSVFEQDIEPPLTTHDNLLAKYQQGIAPGLTVVLNLDSLLNDKRLVVYQELT